MLEKSTSNQHIAPPSLNPPPRPRTAGTASDPKPSFWKRRTILDDVKRDSGLAPSFMSKDSAADAALDNKTHLQVPGQDANVPSIALNDSVGQAREDQDLQRPNSAPGSSRASQQESQEVEERYETPVGSSQVENFSPLSTSIETGGFEDPFSENHLTFSNRGSVLLDGHKAYFDGSRAGSVMSKQSPGMSAKSPNLGVPVRSPSTAERRLSQRVRSMYEGGAIIEEPHAENGGGLGIVGEAERSKTSVRSQHAKSESTDDSKDIVAELPRITSPSHNDLSMSSRHSNGRGGSIRSSYIKMEPWEAAGGIEDYHDVNMSDVDRYGFIRPTTAKSRASSRASTGEGHSPDRTGRNSSQLESPEEGSIKHRKLARPPPDSSRSHRLSVTGHSTHSSRPSSRATSHAPSARSSRSRKSNPFKSSVNKERRWADEAPEMLSAQPGMPHTPGGPDIPMETAKTKTEQRRVEKWEKMAKPLNPTHKSPRPAVGGGQSYTFDVRSPKLIERVWKGIPDVWRAPAWHAFLTASSKSAHKSTYVNDEELVRRYYEHQEKDSLDDIQIDMDVPRTVGQHVMFRARYRGGQRLLFRVLRALALEHPVTGYVQGMAPLAATLLCYFDEERAFICACRLWSDRGLAELFAEGFGGLMSALDVFENKWLAENEAVKKQLDDLGIPPTSYGTKWYLTLFNYALPFEAQLRVWDVFILLGGRQPGMVSASKSTNTKRQAEDDGRFDILHAVSAALIDALQETLVGAEFENAMGALTSHVPVGNEDVLMRVTKREFDERQKRRRKGR